jgi:Cu-Zn family superoxide dismutase
MSSTGKFRHLYCAVGAVLSAAGAVHCAPAHSAIALISGDVLGGQPDSGVRGIVRFTQVKGTKRVAVHVTASGLKPNSVHGFHVHALGNLSEGCLSAGGHFNPSGSPHGSPKDGPALRHVGDLGNVTADAKGEIDERFEDSIISIIVGDENDITGRAVVLHADIDDLGQGGFPDSKTTGHAGARIACGVVGRAADLEA